MITRGMSPARGSCPRVVQRDSSPLAARASVALSDTWADGCASRGRGEGGGRILYPPFYIHHSLLTYRGAAAQAKRESSGSGDMDVQRPVSMSRQGRGGVGGGGASGAEHGGGPSCRGRWEQVCLASVRHRPAGSYAHRQTGRKSETTLCLRPKGTHRCLGLASRYCCRAGVRSFAVGPRWPWTPATPPGAGCLLHTSAAATTIFSVG